jgi:hypothetical protein
MSLKRFGAYAVFMFFVLRAAEGKPLPQNQQPDAAATIRPRSSTDAIRKTAGFMRVTFVEGNQRKEIAGTCFFVFYPDERLGKDRGFAYLVTNRHMAVPRPTMQWT